MRRSLNRIVLTMVVIACGLSTSGCLIGLFTALYMMIGYVSPNGASVLQAMFLFENCPAGVMVDPTTSFVSGTIATQNGSEVSPEYFLRHNPGPTSGSPFIDPLIVQFPANVSGFSGTFSGPRSGALAIQAGLTCVNTVPG